MILFVDGPDGTGKTGYAKYISRQLGYPFLRLEPDQDFGELDGDVIERVSSTFNHTLMQLDEAGVNLVVDRGPISSIVYSELFDRDTPEHAYETLRTVDCEIVYLRCDPKELEIRYDDEKFDDVRSIAEKYDEMMKFLEAEDVISSYITVDTSSGAPDRLQEVFRRV